MNKFGIDVSEHNETIDWNKVKGQVEFAILKLGNIGDNKKFWLDPTFERNYSECKRLNIPIGVYLYCYSNQIANAEQAAREVVNYLKGKELQLPVYIDMEDKEIAVEGKEKLTNICIAFNTIIERAGLWAGVYANENWFNNYLNKNEIKKRYTTWIASYKSGANCYSGEYDIWQNSSNGKVNGINGNVDTNHMYRDLLNEINKKPSLRYKTHVQDIGWSKWQDAGKIAGTTGQAKKLEAIILEGNNGLDIEYRVHVEDIGWQEWKKSGETAGTTGQCKRIEAIEIKSNKDLEAQEHIQDVDWLPVSKGKFIRLGIEGKALRLEAFKINII